MITGRFGQDRWPHERSKARTVFVGPPAVRLFVEPKSGSSPKSPENISGVKKMIPVRVGQAKKNIRFCYVLPTCFIPRRACEVPTHHISKVEQSITKNWLSRRIRVKLRKKDVFHKKTQPSLLDPFWTQKPQNVSNQVFFLKPTMQLLI